VNPVENFALWGTLVNAVAVVIGALLGLLLGTIGKHGGKKAEDSVTVTSERGKLSDAIFAGLALCVIMVGLGGVLKGAVNDRIAAALAEGNVAQLSLSGESTMVVILSITLGCVVGTLLDLDARLNRLGQWLENKMGNRAGNISQGFVTASLLFCVGSMAIVGSLNSGLIGDHSMLYTKSMIDFISAIVFGCSLGVGVSFSAVAVLLYQGVIALAAQWLSPMLTTDVITTMTITGSLLIVALGFNMLGVTKIKIMNYLPAVFLPMALEPLAALVGLA
jgi:uncharacterized membrane protein YqgA involved in biofilm formation